MGGFAIPSPPFSPEPFQADFSSLSARALAYVQAQAGIIPPYTLVNANAAQVPLTIKAAAAQSANIFEIQNSGGTVLAQVEANGRVAVTQAGAYISFSGGPQFGDARADGWATIVANMGSSKGFRVYDNGGSGDIIGVNPSTKCFWCFKGGDVPSAAAITPTGNVFHVTGTTSITSITSTDIVAGTMITIIFDGALTFTDGGNLKLNSDFVTAADDTITLVYDGANWYEVCRSVN